MGYLTKQRANIDTFFDWRVLRNNAVHKIERIHVPRLVKRAIEDQTED